MGNEIFATACAVLLCAISLRAESTNNLKFVPPFEATVAAARSHHLPPMGFDPPVEMNVLEPGDSATLLATLFEKGGRRTQWLIYLKAVEPGEREKKEKPEPPQIVYTSLGHKLDFPSSRAFADVETIGPFVENNSTHKAQTVEDGTSRVELNPAFLGLGFDRAAVAGRRLGKLGDDEKIGRLLSVGQKPFSKRQITKAQEFQATAKLTQEEERAIAAISPALQGYFALATETPQLSKILFKVFDMPSAWSILKHARMPDVFIGAAITDANVEDPRVWHLPENQAVYSFPWAVMVNDQPALEIGAIVTAPRPPFLLTGGVLSLLASDPKDAEKYLTLYLVSARRAAPTDAGVANAVKETPPLFASFDPPLPASPTKTNSPFARIAMIGASVTHGFTASEPFGGKNTVQYNLARYLDAAILAPHDAITNLGNSFFFMAPNAGGDQQIKRAIDGDPTLVVGIDFLFWFCYGKGLDEAGRLKHFDQGLEMLESIKCPLIVGDIPDGSAAVNGMLTPDEMPDLQTIAAANRRLKEWAAKRSTVGIVPLSTFMATVMANEPLKTRGVAVPSGKTRGLIQEDKLHPAGLGCATLALAILDTFEELEKNTSAQAICWDAEKVFNRTMEKLQSERASTPPAP
jgi:hypothetical protein